ncbi:MAG: hypothetical protein RIA63_09365 [Cyclobacteriaceae bacterium]
MRENEGSLIVLASFKGSSFRARQPARRVSEESPHLDSSVVPISSKLLLNDDLMRLVSCNNYHPRFVSTRTNTQFFISSARFVGTRSVGVARK